MNANMRKWIDALRSGVYVQGRTALARTDEDGVTRFCCLGVACDVLEIPWTTREADDSTRRYGEIGEMAVLPPEAVELLEVDSTNPSFRISNMGRPSLTMMNDVGRMTFNEIADVLEKNFS